MTPADPPATEHLPAERLMEYLLQHVELTEAESVHLSSCVYCLQEIVSAAIQRMKEQNAA